MMKKTFLSAALVLGALTFGASVAVPEASARDRTTRGALIGAGAGALVGGVATGRVGGAVAGAVVGGVAGGAIGHSQDRKRRHYSRNDRRYYDDRRYDRRPVYNTRYFNKRGNCYAQQSNGRVVRVSHRPCR